MTHSAPRRLTLALAQINPVVGDVAGNAARAREARRDGARGGADLVVFPELFIAGYPPEDLVLKPAFQAACRKAIDDLARETADGGPGLLIGTPWVEDGRLYNAVALLDGGRIAAVRFKYDLPNYGVFDEKRVFAAGPLPGPVSFRGIRIGALICEDIWGPDPAECIAETGGEMLIVGNGSPYRHDVIDQRLNVVVARVRETGLPLVYVNQNGGQDELVFEGASFAMNADLSFGVQFPAFRDMIGFVTLEHSGAGWRCVPGEQAKLPDRAHADYQACMLGLRDYVTKNGFPGIVLGLSGGVDSALCAALAVDALGAARVHAVMLPYRFTSQASLDDAKAIAQALRIRYDIVPIASAVEGIEAALAEQFKGQPRDVTEENIQARARGVILMALSNKTGAMLVTTGNKSEMSVGYATLYGDMNGGFNPLKDLYKTEVFRLCRLRNSWKPADALGPSGEIIPERVITRPPSAELREDQTDQDSLPPYEMLDAILSRLIEGERAVAEIVAEGFDRDVVARVERMLAVAEYKRRQAAPGVKVTLRGFGRDRRYPITNRFRDTGEPLPKPDDTLVDRSSSISAEAFDA